MNSTIARLYILSAERWCGTGRKNREARHAWVRNLLRMDVERARKISALGDRYLLAEANRVQRKVETPPQWVDFA